MKWQALAGALIVALVLNLFINWGASYYGKAPENKGLQAPPTGQAPRTDEEPISKTNQESRKEGDGTYETTRSDDEKRAGATEVTGGDNRTGSRSSTPRERAEERTGARAERITNTSRVYETLDRHFHKVQAAERQTAEALRLNGSGSSRGLDHDSDVLYSANFEITAYTAGYESTGKRPGHPAYGITATGTTVKEGHTIAADWDVLPPGTVVQIEGLPGDYTVEDKGGAIKGNIIDLYIADLDTALAWGRQERQIYVKEWGE